MWFFLFLFLCADVCMGCVQVMEDTAKDMLEQIPKPVNLGIVMDKYPVMYEQSMNTVLVQEVIRSVNLSLRVNFSQ